MIDFESKLCLNCGLDTLDATERQKREEKKIKKWGKEGRQEEIQIRTLKEKGKYNEKKKEEEKTTKIQPCI